MENRGMMSHGTAAIEAQQMLRAFSHDMRTPIENVIALVTLSLDQIKADSQEGAQTVATYLRKILFAAQEMEMLTDDLLPDNGSMTRQERFTAQDIARFISESMGERAVQKRQLMHIDLSGLGEGAMFGDYAALTRILMNLMSNAVKYTHEGGQVCLTAQGALARNGRINAEFVVQDNGIGMEASFMTHMYEAFAREQKERTIPGHGLGLTIVQRMTQRMGGVLDVRSKPGKGTRFALRVTLETEGHAPAAYTLTGKRILLAEDNELCAQIEQEILRKQGASVQRAADGQQAAALFSATPSGTFDVILMDMHMPVMDGCAAAAQIRGLAHADAKRIPILALTAREDEGDKRMARSAGMNGCLAKPLNTELLCAVLAQ